MNSTFTDLGQYWLSGPSELYRDVFAILSEKVKITKIVYTCLNRILEKEEGHNYSYETLLEDFQIEAKMELFEQDLLNCGKFVVEKIRYEFLKLFNEFFLASTYVKPYTYSSYFCFIN